MMYLWFNRLQGYLFLFVSFLLYLFLSSKDGLINYFLLFFKAVIFSVFNDFFPNNQQSLSYFQTFVSCVMHSQVNSLPLHWFYFNMNLSTWHNKKSSTRPSLFFAMESSTNNNEFLFFSSPQFDDKSLSSAASVQLKLSKDMPLKFCGHASGLFPLLEWPLQVKLFWWTTLITPTHFMFSTSIPEGTLSNALKSKVLKTMVVVEFTPL